MIEPGQREEEKKTVSVSGKSVASKPLEWNIFM